MEHKTSNFQAKSPEMDPGIWSRLPEHLLEHVLSLLPLKTFLRLRPTCKHFKSLIFSHNFVAKHVSSSSKSPFSSFLLFSHPQLRHLYHLYDTILNAWRRVPLSPSPPLSCADADAVLLSISHGLLCFSLPHSSSFLVCNLLQKSSRVVNFPKKTFASSFLRSYRPQTGTSSSCSVLAPACRTTLSYTTQPVTSGTNSTE